MLPPDAPRVMIWTDGSCLQNPGVGGWAALIRKSDGQVDQIFGAAEDTTNNVMELTAVIMALNVLSESSRITLFSDSQYVLNGISQWIFRWKRNGWRTKNNKTVKNVDMWQKLEAATHRHDIIWQWVRGHDGDPNNMLVDRLARNAAREWSEISSS